MLGEATHSALLEAVHSTARGQAGLGSPSRKVIAEAVLRSWLAVGSDNVGQMCLRHSIAGRLELLLESSLAPVQPTEHVELERSDVEASVMASGGDGSQED